MHPFPANKHVVLGITGELSIGYVTLLSLQGQSTEAPWQQHGSTIVVDVSGVPNGMYIARIDSERGVLTVPVMVMR